MYIAPNTNVYILTGVPIDSGYTHTLYFASAAAQLAYFTSKKKHTLTKQYYQRYDKGVIRVQIKAEDLYNCNYLMFQNENFGNKWFYAFIKSIDYVNNITSEIRYEIDVMQTWAFDYTLLDCFVQREHTETDVIGENTLPENVELGPYISNAVDVISPGKTSRIGGVCFVCTFNADLEPTNGQLQGNVFSGLSYIIKDTAAEAAAFIAEVTEANKLDGIIASYVLPSNIDTSGGIILDQVSTPKRYSNLDGYVPRNNKLYTWPYNLLKVSTDSNQADFRYELFGDTECKFHYWSTISPSPNAIIIPTNYANSGEEAIDERMTLSDYPQVAFSSDVYKMYLAQNQASLPVKMIGGIAGGIASIAMGNPVGGALSLFDTIAGEMAKQYDTSTKAPQANGTQSCSSDYALGLKQVYARQISIRAEYAKRIDQYFDMFGYSVNTVKKPNTHSRPEWNYVKTVGCELTANAPADDVSKICEIYDRGITLWKNPEHVGDYSLNNQP